MKFRPFFILACLAALQATVFSTIPFLDLHPDELSEIFGECITDGFIAAKLLQKKAIASTKPSFRASHSFKKASFRSNVASLCFGQGMLQASLLVKERLGISDEMARKFLQSIELDSEVCQKVFDECVATKLEPIDNDLIELPDGTMIPRCANNMFRTITGYCNNVVNLEYGTSDRAFNRLLPTAYDDGLDAPRGYIKNNLPSPRLISQTLSRVPPSNITQIVTQMVKVWGQFLDHDLTRTPEASAGMGEEGETLTLECCEDGEIIEEEFSPECLPIPIPLADSFFRDVNITCLPFIRSIPADSGCKFGPREQINEVTAFLDASNVYGSTEEEMSNLRVPEGGNEGDLAASLESEFITDTCTVDPESLLFLPSGISENPSFRAGDIRVNEQPSLAALHTVWVRIHNKIAANLRTTEGFIGNSDLIYETARKIVAALMQHFTYNDFLPLVIGDDQMRSFALYSQIANRFNDKYDPLLNPTIFNVFGTAAFRFGHTLITNNMSGIDPFFLGENFFTAATLFGNENIQPSSILESEARMPGLPTDVLLADVLTNRLALAPPEDLEVGFPLHGNDLMALNIQRGREHGIPPYNAWRRYCGLPVVQTLVDLKKVMDPNAATEFFGLYSDVDDIDIFPAGLAEKPADGGGILGPTFSCLIAKQFEVLKFGDRFFYENSRFIHANNPAIAFTPAQLRIIKSSTFAQLLCEVTCSAELPADVFKVIQTEDDIMCGQTATRSELFLTLEDGTFYR